MNRITTALLITMLLAGAAAHVVGLCYAFGLLDEPWLVASLGAYGLITSTFLVLVVWTNVRRPSGVEPSAARFGRRAADRPLMDQIGDLMEQAAAEQAGRPARTPHGEG